MTLFITKNLLAAATLGLILPLSAQARPYDVCYAENKDAIGCWLSEALGGDYIHFGDPGTPEEQAEVQTLRAKGYMKLDPIKGEMIEKKAGTMKINPIKGESPTGKAQAKGAKHVQVCKTGEIIEMIKGKVPAEKIAASCYK
ncbi:hypothetical protein EOK75_05875 [Pseudorhodobacter turbinis]|uniref:Uncharacterized protein n=1 Tax=Pseudorhodobacter turbinis TaxID=2500533 RepID=A0A4V1E0P4_9RHOB|nr:hypothetical protein [Pseudorhodobacter turbinis]QCO55344.1 hypothetical protein EOK75_05875 [Pseudorhodobacter turbinis]